jgi:hypothetical protein
VVFNSKVVAVVAPIFAIAFRPLATEFMWVDLDQGQASGSTSAATNTKAVQNGSMFGTAVIASNCSTFSQKGISIHSRDMSTQSSKHNSQAEACVSGHGAKGDKSRTWVRPVGMLL